MKILYYSEGDGVPAIVEALRHVGRLPNDRAVYPNEVETVLKQLAYSEQPKGQWISLGKDGSGNDVYACGTNHSKEILERAWAHFVNLAGDSMADWSWIDVDSKQSGAVKK